MLSIKLALHLGIEPLKLVQLLVCRSKRFYLLCDVRLQGFLVNFQVCRKLLEIEVGITAFAKLLIKLFDNPIFLLELCPHIRDLFCLPRQLKLCLLEFRVGSLSVASLLSHLLLQAPQHDTQTLDLSILRS